MSRYLIHSAAMTIAGLLIVAALLSATKALGITLPSPTAFIAPGSAGYVVNTAKSLLEFAKPTLLK